MMASAVRTYLNRFAVRPGRRAAIFTSSDDAWTTALDLSKAGVHVEAILDARREIDPRLAGSARQAGIAVFPGAQVLDTRGARELKTISIRSADGRFRDLAVDLLAVSGGWSPNLGLATHLGGKPSWSDALAAFVPGSGHDCGGRGRRHVRARGYLERGHEGGGCGGGGGGIYSAPSAPAESR
jgi:sarcosine oxidase subunit alpha